MNNKIIQILNTNKNMAAQYDSGDGNIFECPVVCLALVENNEGYRYVELMDMTSDGEIDFSGYDDSHFLGVKVYD
ncbi:hypothetical protein [Staphylococcus haemolyticus]|uniref:hypothetical protein n=1 Tax=Staphylococcus haemolyticus TaxID=1283 RepID=UPI0011A946B9|nr:hypothetical protein [Staphylococcus haemolyticus]